MSPEAELVKQIAAKGFSEARDLVGCLAILREGDSYTVKRAIESAKAALAANIVQRALLQRMLMTVERAFAPHHRKSDHHARVAFELLSNQTIFDEVATAGSRKPLEQACAFWRTYDTDDDLVDGGWRLRLRPETRTSRTSVARARNISSSLSSRVDLRLLSHCSGGRTDSAGLRRWPNPLAEDPEDAASRPRRACVFRTAPECGLGARPRIQSGANQVKRFFNRMLIRTCRRSPY
jgi:hypothetical protein